MIRNEATLAIVRERGRQEDLVAAGAIPWNCSDPAVAPALKLAVLAEEFGEVGKAILDRNEDGAHGLKEELVQVAAVALAWLESLA